jgi:pantetheine-phosphate adenylyltransferase
MEKLSLIFIGGKNMKIAVYPGSFDPITNGHIDILKRALEVFDKVIVLVSFNSKKKSNFSPIERKEMILETIKELNLDNVEVEINEGLTVSWAKEKGARHLIRGLRAVTDFEYEFQMASANEFADKEVDMVFFMARNDTSFISSSTILELHSNGVDVSKLVPKAVYKALKSR